MISVSLKLEGGFFISFAFLTTGFVSGELFFICSLQAKANNANGMNPYFQSGRGLAGNNFIAGTRVILHQQVKLNINKEP